MPSKPITQHILSAVAAAILLLLTGVILSYFLYEKASYTSDWKETVKFSRNIKSCAEAERKAEADYKHGLIRMYFSGDLTEQNQDRFPYNFYKHLEEDYGIDVIYTGDRLSAHHKCYNLRMDDLLDEKLGEHTVEELFNRLREEEYPNESISSRSSSVPYKSQTL